MVGDIVRSPDAVVRAGEMIDARRRVAEGKLAALREIEPYAVAAASSDAFPHVVLRYGLESSEWVIARCEPALAELSEAQSKAHNTKRRP